MKHIAIIGTILILLILTAGCLDDLSSTLPPCCDGTCDGVKTSVITVDCSHNGNYSSEFKCYIVDSDNLQYGWGNSRAIISDKSDYMNYYNPYNNHNVTFSYEMVDGHRHITGIIEDHDSVKACRCCRASKTWGNFTNYECYQCVQKCCGCEGK